MQASRKLGVPLMTLLPRTCVLCELPVCRNVLCSGTMWAAPKLPQECSIVVALCPTSM